MKKLSKARAKRIVRLCDALWEELVIINGSVLNTDDKFELELLEYKHKTLTIRDAIKQKGEI